MKDTLHDEREIDSIWYPGDRDENYAVGRHGVEKIEPYGEPGQGARVPWFAIWIDGRVVARVNAAMLREVCYKVKESSLDDLPF